MFVKSKQAISAVFYQNLFLIFQVAEFLKKGKLGHGKRRKDIWSRNRRKKLLLIICCLPILRVIYALDITQRDRR
jgi:hypothetical protein